MSARQVPNRSATRIVPLDWAAAMPLILSRSLGLWAAIGLARR